MDGIISKKPDRVIYIYDSTNKRNCYQVRIQLLTIVKRKEKKERKELTLLLSS